MSNITDSDTDWLSNAFLCSFFWRENRGISTMFQNIPNLFLLTWSCQHQVFHIQYLNIQMNLGNIRDDNNFRLHRLQQREQAQDMEIAPHRSGNY